MVTKKTSQTLDVNELVGKPTPAAASTAAAKESAPAPVEPTAPAAPAPVHHTPVRPHRIHIGGERAGDNTMPSANQNYTNQYTQQNNTPTEEVKGFLDSQPEGHGFLRPKFIHSSRDIYISQSQIRRFMLRPGDLVEGVARPPKDTERYYGLLKVEKVNGMPAEDAIRRPHFDDLTPIYPDRQVKLATDTTPLSTRMIDLIAPIGFGQRGMIVSPPKAGKTTILKEIAAGISANFPDVHLMAALIGERPEEVTDISMSVKGEVVASNFDEPPENQTRVAEITLDRAKRMVELGKDVVILLDSITRLARAYNLSVEPSGRTLSGGFDPAALHPAKRFFGAARNCQEGGSLTIIGTALVETGSRMDDLIYEEFKGTGNMELHLSRGLAERRIYPAISIERSGTRGEERILPEANLKKIVTMRRMMDMLGADERTAIFVERLGKTKSNDEFLEALGKS
jgi:transcription termination factor Rho